MASEHWQAEFIDTATSPASTLRVKIPGFDHGAGSFMVVWSPLGGALPMKGDKALVVEADDGTWWAVAWWSAAQAASHTFNVTGVSSVDLGAIPGESITGVRITLAGRTFSTGGNTFLRLKPNGLVSMTTGAVANRSYVGAGPGYAATGDNLFGGALATSPGIVIAETDWGTASNNVFASGVIFTKLNAGGQHRSYLGECANQDAVTDGNNRLSARIHSIWGDASTAVTSLALALDAGTFTGRIVVEQLP
jgi:hypothetical protein